MNSSPNSARVKGWWPPANGQWATGAAVRLDLPLPWPGPVEGAGRLPSWRATTGPDQTDPRLARRRLAGPPGVGPGPPWPAAPVGPGPDLVPARVRPIVPSTSYAVSAMAAPSR